MAEREWCGGGDYHDFEKANRGACRECDHIQDHIDIERAKIRRDTAREAWEFFSAYMDAYKRDYVKHEYNERFGLEE